MKTAIVTDSNSGIFEADGREKGIYVVPMPVIIEGKTYYEGTDLTHEQFFKRLSEHRAVSTSQPNPEKMISIWNEVLKSGYDELVYIPMSSGLSGSCQTAQVFAQDFEGRVEVVDNHRISITLRHAVEDALVLRQKGYSALQIRETLERDAHQSVAYVGVNTLEYLKASGRVTAAGAALGTVMSIKPLLIIEGERLDAYAKVRGTKSCQKHLIEAIQKNAEQLTKNGEKLHIGVTGSFVEYEEAKLWEEMVQNAFPDYEVNYEPLTFSISSHVGPNAFGMGISKITTK